MLILFAEDEPDLAELTIDYLQTEYIECDYASNGVMALNLLSQQQYEVIVLDITMPKLDGFSVCQRLKTLGIDTPVIFLTARDNLDDKLLGFELGGDDYLTKPFELAELAARIKVLAKRKVVTSQQFSLDSLVINYPEHQVSRGARNITLSATQWQLLILLAKSSPNVVSKMTIENEIWPQQDVNKDMYKTLIFRLRNLIDGVNDKPLVRTIRGAGIALKPQDSQ